MTESDAGGARTWDLVHASLRKKVTAAQYRTWFQGLALVACSEERVSLLAPSRYCMDWLARHFLGALQDSFQEVTGCRPEVELDYVRANRQATPAREKRVSPPPPANGTEATDPLLLNDLYRFENFVVGTCNSLSHAAAQAVADAPGSCYNPLFLHGGVGLGKTHLLQAICHTLLDRNKRLRLHYVSCESFVNQFISAIEKRQLEAFRSRYRHVEVLLVDDIHYLADKERTQEEFFHTFNSLYNAKKQIILSCDSSPKEIPTLQERLVSRFKWGLVTRIEPPEFETRAAIVNQKARLRGIALPQEVSGFIAETFEGNIRELEGALNRVLAHSRLRQVPDITLPFVRECLGDLLKDLSGRSRPVGIADIVAALAAETGVRAVDLQSRSRARAISFPRQVCMFLVKKLTTHSLEEIGRHFGGRDHSTVVYALDAVRSRLAAPDDALEQLIQRVEGSLSRARRTRS